MKTASASHDVSVSLGDRSYTIRIGQGLLPAAGEAILPYLARPRAFVVTDQTVAGLHLQTLLDALAAVGAEVSSVIIPAGEASKSMQELERVLDALAEAGAERDDLIIALGGGVVGDLAGLAAGLLKRGARFVQVPTTLLAQVDSSVGGKTAINLPSGKNLAGLFHQPVLVLADIGVLSTLPERERAAGLAEVVKYGLIDDPDFIAFIEAHADELRAGAPGPLGEAVRRSCAAKARIVAADETEQGVRALLNLGHTFGHAIERANGFGPAVLHGEAVATGMCLALRYSVAQGLCPSEDSVRTDRLIEALGLSSRLTGLGGVSCRSDDLIAHMAHDKKAKNGALTLILSRGIGAAFIQKGALLDPLRAFLQRETGEAAA
jgi:3-dehydroquinate synthase